MTGEAAAATGVAAAAGAAAAGTSAAGATTGDAAGIMTTGADTIGTATVTGSAGAAATAEGPPGTRDGSTNEAMALSASSLPPRMTPKADAPRTTPTPKTTAAHESVERPARELATGI